MPGTAVIIVAAGRGHRFGTEMPKQFLHVQGKPLIRHAVEAFLSHPGINMVLPVIHPDDAGIVADALKGLDTLPAAVGGTERQDSVRNGLEALSDHQPERVLVHDAARPRVTRNLIDVVLAALEDHMGVIPGVAVVDTLKRTDTNGLVIDTVPRNGLWRAQTPQGFSYPILYAAHQAAAGQALTDDAAVMEAAGHAVVMVPGDDNNIKVTTPADLEQMERIMVDNGGYDVGTANLGKVSPMMRIGSGYDVHRLGPGDHVTLCGIEIPHDQALVGHSDADVALHALCDAIFGALGDGDIGSHFPPSDEKWRGASSDRFVEYACERMRTRGFELQNLDLTIICERPKIGPHRDAMRERIAEITGIDASCISVKATTTERLGFTGRGEGIAADASVLIAAGS